MTTYNRNRLEQQDVKAKVQLYFEVNRFDAAEKLLKSTLVKNGPDAALYNLLGVTFHKQSRFSDAIKHFRLALRENPNFTEAAINLASTHCDVSQYDEAQEIYQQLDAVVDHSRNVSNLTVGRLANLHAESGRAYARAGLVEDAILELQKALQLFPRLPDVKLDLAQLYLKNEALDRAKQELESLIQIAPDMIDAYNLLGLVCMKLNQHETALTHWESAAVIDPADPTARMYLRGCRDSR